MADKDKNSKLLNIKQLGRDYLHGSSAFGYPSRGYYIVTDQGMETLQAFATREYVLNLTGEDKSGGHIREVGVVQNDDMVDYNMTEHTKEEYVDLLRDKLVVGGIPASDLEDDMDVYLSVIDDVYAGYLDRNSFIDTLTDSKYEDTLRYSVFAMKHDVLRAREGDAETDFFANAGSHAYYNVIVPKYRESMSNGQSGSIKNESISLADEDDLMVDSARKYLEHLVDDETNNIRDAIPLRFANNIMDSLVNDSKELKFYEREDSWNNLIDYLQDDIVIMFDDPSEIEMGKGLEYLDTVHEAIGVKIIDDLNYEIPSFDEQARALGYDVPTETEKLMEKYLEDDGLDF